MSSYIGSFFWSSKPPEVSNKKGEESVQESTLANENDSKFFDALE
jgi:hypothetical protein